MFHRKDAKGAKKKAVLIVFGGNKTWLSLQTIHF
jgi:hypothetical protein